MWELGQQLGDVRMASSQSVAPMQNIHVLLVDHDPDGLLHTIKLLEICQYRVTFVELASAAISLIMSGKAKFDVVIENINSPDLHGFKLLQHAVSSSIPVVLMAADENAYMALKYLESGAFLYIKKPVTLEILKCLWQHVQREKLRLNMTKQNQEIPVESEAAFREVVHPNAENPNANYNVEGTVDVNNNNGTCNKRSRRRNGTNEDEGNSNHLGIHRNNVKKKMCTEWTEELHKKFMNSVEKLGEGRCFPKDILELMNVPGLTRMQVASHLQKCRNDNWRSPEERKALQFPHLAYEEETNGSQTTHPKPRRFGSKPLLGKPLSGPHEDQPNNPGLETDQINPGININDPSAGAVPKTASARQACKKYGSGPGSNSFSRAGKPHQSPNDNLQLASEMNRNPNPSQPGVFLFNQIMVNNYHPQNSEGASGDSRSHWSSGTTSSNTEREPNLSSFK